MRIWNILGENGEKGKKGWWRRKVGVSEEGIYYEQNKCMCFWV